MPLLGIILCSALTTTALGSADPQERRCITQSDGHYSCGPITADAGTIELRISAAAFPRRATVRATITGQNGASWQLQLAERQIGIPVQIRLPRGNYALTLELPHHIRFHKMVSAGETRETITAELKALPVLSGVVSSRATGRPIAGAILSADVSNKVLTDSAGHFALELEPEAWPSKITVSSPGYADATIMPPRAHVSAMLDEILLSVGGTIAVSVSDEAAKHIAEAALLKRQQGHLAGIPYRTLTWTTPLVFENVEPGEYIVVLKGREPGQRQGTPVTVAAAELKTVRPDLKPFELRLRAERAGEPVINTTILIQNHDGHWEEKVTTNDQGEAHVELWQGGKTSAWLESKAMTAPYVEHRTLSDGEDADWLLDVPMREITGVVVDSATGDPIPKAALSLHMEGEGSGIGVRTSADDNGRFRFAPVSWGTHTLKAGAKDHLPGEMSYTFLEPEQSRNLTIRLDAAARIKVTVTDMRGMPLGDARVLHFRGLRMLGSGRTDAAGTIEIPMPKDETREVYVIPRDGSLAFTQLRSDAAEATVRVPDGTSRIVIRAESEVHAAIPNVSTVIRYDGHILPIDVLLTLATVQGMQTRSGADGRIVLNHMPPGAYEFWPVGSPEELQQTIAAAGAEAPVRMTVVPGENAAVLTFTAQ